jgi:uncharacterized membrane protein YidH (DUF202 family)
MRYRPVFGCLLLGSGLVLAILGVVEFMAIDSCLDRGGAYDYAARRCSFDVQPVGRPDQYDVLAFFVGIALVVAGWIVLGTNDADRKEVGSNGL